MRRHAIIVLVALGLGLAPGPAVAAGGEGDEKAVQAMLEDLHAAARAADGERFFGHLLPDAILFGTDKSERWTLETYRAFIEPYMDQGVGWTGVPRDIHVFFSDSGKVAWFDGRVDKPGFQECRITGVLKRVEGAWKVAQFNFAFTVPNEIAREVATLARKSEE